MAAGNYQVDLTTLNLGEATTGWSDLNVAGGGGGALSIEIDFAIQGTFAITRQVTNNTRGATYNNGATTLGADDHYYLWTVCSTPGITVSKTAGGIVGIIGNSNTAYSAWYLNGNDTLPEGGMQNYAIHSSSATSTTVGGGLVGNPTIFGSYIQTNGTSKSDNYAIDAIRYGTGYYIFDGDVTTPITFESASQDNDLSSNRYGVFSGVPGGFELKGRFVVGQTTASVATQAYMDDSNVAIAFVDTEYSLSDFTQINFDHPLTVANLTNVSFTAVGTNNPGQFNVLDAQTTASFESLVFNSTGQTNFNANTQVSSSTWNTCDYIRQSGSGITTSTFNGTSTGVSQVISDDPSLINNCTWNGNGFTNGITVVTPGEYNFTGNIFTGFGSIGTSRELRFDPPGGTGDLTINILGGGTNLRVNNLSSGTVTINNNIQVTLTGMKDFTEVRVLDVTTPSNPVELAGIENVVSASVGANDNDFAFSLAAGTDIDIAIHALSYDYLRISNFTVPTADTEIPIQQQFDRNYNNP